MDNGTWNCRTHPKDFVDTNASEDYKNGFMDGYNNYLSYINWIFLHESFTSNKILRVLAFAITLSFPCLLKLFPNTTLIVFLAYSLYWYFYYSACEKANDIDLGNKIAESNSVEIIAVHCVFTFYFQRFTHSFNYFISVTVFTLYFYFVSYLFILICKKIYGWKKDCIKIPNSTKS